MRVNFLDKKYYKDFLDIFRIFTKDELEDNPESPIIITGNRAILDRQYSFTSRHELKKILYEYFSRSFDYKSPWGLMTGTKPLKLYRKLGDKQLEKEYYVSQEKVGLLEEIRRVQDNFEYSMSNIHLYINIPFCPSRCSYCSFPTIIYPKNDRRSEYIDALKKELKAFENFFSTNRIRSIYVGGGTPTALSHDQLEDLLSLLKSLIDLDQLEEYTVEAGREDSLDFKKLKLMKEYGVTRISINPQTFCSRTLEYIGRKQDNDRLIKLYKRARNLGFDINMDLILGLKDEGLDELKDTLKKMEKLRPDNLTVHTLSIKRGSKLADLEACNNYSSNIGSMVDYSFYWAKKKKYRPYYLYRQKNIMDNYENIGYCLNRKASIYNIAINEEVESIIAFGMTANSKILTGGRVKKYTNYKNLDDYINRLEEEIEDKRILLEGKRKRD